jgi:uncharacterized protein YhaN
MRITDLYIDGYGTFQDCRLEGLPSGLVLFLGQNEAGKSTCLGFIRDMLFGFPDGRSKEKTYPPLKGGRWGGSLTLQTKDWSQLNLNRGPGKRGGALEVTGPQGESLSPEIVSSFLAGTTREVFKNVYAFSLSELQTLETLNNERVKDAIYSAGLGAGLASLPDIQKQLNSKREKLFKPGGKQQEINIRLRKLEDVRAELKKVSGEIEAFDKIVQERDLLDQENEGLKKELSKLRVNYSKLKSMFSLWEDWIERLEFLRQLQDLPQISNFPQEGLKEYQNLSQQLQDLTERRQGLQSEKDTLEKRLESLHINQKLLENERDIRRLAEQKTSYQELKEELLGLEPEISSKEETLQELKQRLGLLWSREALMAFDCSLKVKEQIGHFSKNLQARERELERAVEKHRQCLQEEEKAQEALEIAQKEVANWSIAEFDWDEDLVGELKRNRDRFAQALEEISSWKDEYRQSRHRVSQFLTEINPAWEIQELENFDTSLQVKEHIEQLQSEFDFQKREIDKLDQELASLEERAQTLKQKKQNRAETLHNFKTPRFQSLDQIREMMSSVHRFRRQKSELEKVGSRIEVLKNGIEGLNREKKALPEASSNQQTFLVAALLSFLMALASLGLNLWGFMQGSPVYFLIGFLGLAGLLFAGLFSKEKKKAFNQSQKLEASQKRISSEKAELEDELREKQDVCSQLQTEISEVVNILGLKDENTDLESLESELEAAREVLQQKAIIEQEIENLDSELQSIEDKQSLLRKRRQECSESKDALEKNWRQEVESLNLSKDIRPAAALRIVSRIETAQTELSHLRNVEKHLQQLESFLENYTQKALEVKESQGVKRDQLEQILSAVDRHLERVERERERQKNKEDAEKTVHLKKDELSRLKRARENAEQELAKAREEDENKVQEWKDWLQKIGLDQDLSPDLARESIAYIERAQTLVNEIVQLENKQKQFKKRLDDFQGSVSKLAQKLGEDGPEEQFLIPFVQKLVEELENSKANQKRKNDLQESLEEKDKNCKELDLKLYSLQKEIEELFRQAGVSNADDFLDKGNLFAQRQETSKRLQELDRNLLKGTGYKDIDTVKEQFSNWDKESLEQELVAIEQELEEKESKRQEISKRMGELQAELKNKASADDVSRLRQQEEFLLEELRQLAFRWSKNTLALFLIRKAKQKYEQEQQPQVLKTAGHYLSKITDGAYNQVYAPLGEDEIKIIAQNGTAKKPEELSRGTAEQLYLSLRFGYMDNAGSQGERLPVIMDDILVNFDQSRAENAARAIAELAQKNQILYFTCHPQTLELFSKTTSNPPVFSLDDGKIYRFN